MSRIPTHAEDFYNDDGKTLDQEDRFALVEVPLYRKWNSWVIHGCKDYYEGAYMGHELGCYVSCDLSSQECHLCKTKTPARLQTLWTLHNFDCIQNESPRR